MIPKLLEHREFSDYDNWDLTSSQRTLSPDEAFELAKEFLQNSIVPAREIRNLAMDEDVGTMSEAQGQAEALRIFEMEIGTAGVVAKSTTAGNRSFLKFVVGRDAPIYQHALRETQKSLSENNPFRGKLGLAVQKGDNFPESLEAGALQTLLTRSTRAVSEDAALEGFSVPYVPFQNREDHQLAQPASHVVVGRRGVGKSTLIMRAAEIIRTSSSLIAILDAQTYSLLSGEDLMREVLHDVANAVIADASRMHEA
jgi:hypothetical protein